LLDTFPLFLGRVSGDRIVAKLLRDAACLLYSTESGLQSTIVSVLQTALGVDFRGGSFATIPAFPAILLNWPLGDFEVDGPEFLAVLVTISLLSTLSSLAGHARSVELNNMPVDVPSRAVSLPAVNLKDSSSRARTVTFGAVGLLPTVPIMDFERICLASFVVDSPFTCKFDAIGTEYFNGGSAAIEPSYRMG
jgi:hypothetical protein